MAAPTSGLIKIFPDNTSIINGEFALNSDASPQPSRPVSDLDAYYDARVTNLAVAPCFRRNPVFPVAGDYELSFSPSSIRFEFYNSYPGPIVDTISFLEADFPTGMVIIQPRLYWTGRIFAASTTMNFKFFGSIIDSFTFINGDNTGSVATGINDILSPLVRWSIIQLMKPFGFHVNYNTGNAIGCITSEFFILSEYNTLKFQFTNNTPNVLPGNIADITDASAAMGSLDINQFRIYWDTLEGEEDVNSNFPGWTGGELIPRNLILEFTASRLRFIMPNYSGLPYGGRRLMLTGTGNSVNFVGEFPLQNFNIELVDGSGLYTLVDNKRNDTYYDRSVVPSTTIDLKIPDPYVKTGFFNS